ncbi:MAG: AAA family ATPase [Bacteroidales bacterium]|nr:AAA family ATPase [Bacteroidales bacterium]
MFEFSKSVFGGEFPYVGTFGEMPPQEGMPPLPDQMKDQIMHISLPISRETVLMGSDAGGEWSPKEKGGGAITYPVFITNDSHFYAVFITHLLYICPEYITWSMIFNRKALFKLMKWKESPGRKPLLIRGARQVGKSTLIRQFAAEFTHFIELNLEKDQYRRLFEEVDSVSYLMDAIYLITRIPKTDKPTLLFLDEIQESPKAIQQLRYFYEELPHLYVVAAGSLLEFVLKKVASFPVGRVEQMVLHPFDFEEFLMAEGNQQALTELNTIPCHGFGYQSMTEQFHNYTIVGGMPEAIKQYVTDHSFANIGGIYDALWQGYKDDAEKYASNQTERKIIRHVIDSSPNEKDRISFEGFGNSVYRSREIGKALRALDLARVVRLVYPSTSLTPPMNEDLKKRPRLQFLDTGLLNHALNIQAEMIGVNDLHLVCKGRIIQHMVIQELQSQHDSTLYKPHFWVREKAKSSAEVDLVYHYKQYLIPIEIKSGEQGKLRSLHQFMESCGHPYAVRLLANRFSVENVKTPSGIPYLLMNLPYYLGTKLPQYIEWFIHNYRTI